MYEPSMGEVGAAKYTAPAACEATAGRERSDDAAGPSVATTIARAEMVWPFSRVTEPGVVDMTRVFR